MDTEPAKGEQPPMKTITIYHNPKCGTSRNVLALIRNSGVEPEVIEYLKTPPTKARLAELVAATGQGVRAPSSAKKARPTPSWAWPMRSGATTSCSTSCWPTPSSSTARWWSRRWA